MKTIIITMIIMTIITINLYNIQLLGYPHGNPQDLMPSRGPHPQLPPQLLPAALPRRRPRRRRTPRALRRCGAAQPLCGAGLAAAPGPASAGDQQPMAAGLGESPPGGHFCWGLFFWIYLLSSGLEGAKELGEAIFPL